ncbi:MAG: Ig-like domain-containing protein [Cytophagales bacterium]
MKNRLYNIMKYAIAACLINLWSNDIFAQTLDADVPTGFSIVNASSLVTTTGGGDGKVVTAKTYSEMTTYCGSADPLIILVEGTITGTNPFTVKSNKTIIGKAGAKLSGCGFSLSGVSNIIIRNLIITGSGDGVAARNTHHLWVDHCDIFDNGDGLLDITQQSSYCTVTWCKFYYVNQTEHRLACLIGSGGGDHPEDWGYLKVTYHHNWFADKVDQRMPRLMYGQAHVYNDYYTASGNGYCFGVGSYGAALLENNYFKNVANPHQLMYDIYCWMTVRGNVYDNTTGAKHSGKLGSRDVGVAGWAFPVTEFSTAPYLYSLDKGSDVPNLVSKGASVKADFAQIGLVPSPGQGAINIKNPVLKWTKGTIGRDATSYKVYLGTSTNPALVSTVTTQSYTPINLIAGTVYYWKVDMVTPSGTIAGKLWQFKTDGTAPANTAPTVSITAPANNANYTEPASINITANASDANGTVSSVDFYNGTTLLGSDASAPYSYTWSNVAAGTYTITAKATDNLGAVTTSSAITVVVKAIPTDCNGTPNGTATLDNCGRCVGGTTTKTACVGSSEIETDACIYDGVLETKNAGFKGTAYININNAIGSQLSFNVNAASAGAYTLSFRYAAGGTVDRPAAISVNGTSLPSNLSFPATGAFTTYKTVEMAFTLRAGSNSIILASTTADGLANIDQVGYVSSGVNKGGCVVTGVEDITNDQLISIYPNPSKTNFHLKASQSSNVLVLDVDGKVLEKAENVTDFEFGKDLKPGIYLLKVENRIYKIVKE